MREERLDVMVPARRGARRWAGPTHDVARLPGDVAGAEARSTRPDVQEEVPRHAALTGD